MSKVSALSKLVFLLITIVIAFYAITSYFSSNRSVYIPILADNQECVFSYLRKISYFSDSKNPELKQLPFEINSPIPIVGLLELKQKGNRDMQSIYNGMKLYCYLAERQKTVIHSGDWSGISDDLISIAEKNNSNFDMNKSIYFEVNIPNKTYTIYQQGKLIRN